MDSFIRQKGLAVCGLFILTHTCFVRGAETTFEQDLTSVRAIRGDAKDSKVTQEKIARYLALIDQYKNDARVLEAYSDLIDIYLGDGRTESLVLASNVADRALKIATPDSPDGRAFVFRYVTVHLTVFRGKDIQDLPRV